MEIREKEKEKKRAVEMVRVKLTAEARLLMVAGEQCLADNDWLAARQAWKEASRVTETMNMKRRVKVKIAEEDEEACRLAREVKSLRRPRGWRTWPKDGREGPPRAVRSLEEGIGVKFHTPRGQTTFGWKA